MIGSLRPPIAKRRFSELHCGATDKIQRDIEDYLKSRGLFYDRRKNFYKNSGKPRDVIIDIPYLAQAVMAILLRRPDTARGATFLAAENGR